MNRLVPHSHCLAKTGSIPLSGHLTPPSATRLPVPLLEHFYLAKPPLLPGATHPVLPCFSPVTRRHTSSVTTTGFWPFRTSSQ